jgi:enhancer of polycomb-like protein
LQQAIKAAAGVKAKDAYIPTPPTIASNVQYDVLYPQRFRQPATYIRSSSTVEDCAGVPYCMDEEDEVALKLINSTLPRGVAECSEDLFEEVTNFFEETAQNKQPFASVDSPPVLPLDELEEQLDDTINPEIRTYLKFIYEHWKSRRIVTGNRGLSPRLKFETGQESDDADPYVCFRRRELRQIRKTRNRDAQSAEKLRRMRKELEEARQLLAMVKQRELSRREVLQVDRLLFQQRTEVKETKRKLGIKGDDEDLINQKVMFRSVFHETLTNVDAAQEAGRGAQSRPAGSRTPTAVTTCSWWARRGPAPA